MSKEPEARPITVSELLARNDGESFPRSDAPVRRSRRISERTSHDRPAAGTASGMPEFTVPATPAPHRTVGASGMPGYTPQRRAAGTTAPEPDEREQNVVTGIIPVVTDEPAEQEEPETVADAAAAVPAVAERDAAVTEVVEMPAEVATGGAAAGADGTGDGTAPAAGDDRVTTGELPVQPDPVAATAVTEVAGVPAAAGPSGADGEPEPSKKEAKAQRKREARERREAAKRAKREAKQDAKRQAGAGEDEPDEREAKEPSALRTWLMLLTEVVGGIAVGAGMFWGFTQIWRWNVYFALVLAVVVIFAIVSFAHVLRKKDLPTTLLALAAGLLVTLGPLVFLFLAD